MYSTRVKLTVTLLLTSICSFALANSIILDNAFIRAELQEESGAWRQTRIERVDGSDLLPYPIGLSLPDDLADAKDEFRHWYKG